MRALTVLLVAAAAIGDGRRIYDAGIGRDPVTVNLMGGDYRPAAGQLTCRSCHGDDGTGGREGGIVAPPLDRARKMDEGARRAWLRDALVRHRGRDGGVLDAAMPRYRLSARDLAALADHVATFPNPPVAGVTAERVTIRVDPQGAGLSGAGLAALDDALRDRTEALRGAGGIFGREVVFAVDAGEALATIGWSGGGDRLVVRGEAGCGTIEPSGDMLSVHRRDAGGGDAIVAPGDMNLRAAAARVLLGRYAIDPREAMVLVAYGEAADLIVTALREAGRRLFSARVCARTRLLADDAQKVSIIRGAAVTVLPARTTD